MQDTLRVTVYGILPVMGSGEVNILLDVDFNTDTVVGVEGGAKTKRN